MSVRVARSRRLVAEGYPLASVARVLGVSRQALYRTPKPRTVPKGWAIRDPPTHHPPHPNRSGQAEETAAYEVLRATGNPLEDCAAHPFLEFLGILERSIAEPNGRVDGRCLFVEH